MELVSGKVWTERKIVVILNVTTIFALHEKRRKSSFRKSYKKDILADFCSSVKETNERRFKS